MTTTRITVRVQPGARRSEVVGWDGETLRARVQAPAAEGRANEGLLRLLAEVLDVPRSWLSIARGATSRTKVVAVEELTAEQVYERLKRGLRR